MACLHKRTSLYEGVLLKHMSAETKSPLQASLRRAFVSAAAWLNSYKNEKS